MISLTENTKADFNSPWLLTAGIGAHYWGFNFDELESSVQRKQTESTLIGLTASIGFMKPINKHFYLGSGFNYNRLYSKIVHTFET